MKTKKSKKSTLKIAKEQAKELNLDELLQEICVGDVDEEHADLNNIKGLIGWYYVSDLDGVNTYFSTEREAFHYRLDFINRILNS